MSAISIETKRIDELEALSEVAADGQLLYYAADGKATNKVTMDDILNYIRFVSPNSIFRGKYLGDTVTDEQLEDISSGAFKLVQLGDYWTMGGHNWRNWGANSFLHKGDTELTKNHIVVMPDDNLLKSDGSTTHYMNDTKTTDGGYKGSKLRGTYVPQMVTTITGLFGADHVLSHRELISNTVASGTASNWEWVDSQVEIPTEVMMYGSTVWDNSGYNTGANYPILPLAAVRPNFVVSRRSNGDRENSWFRDVASASGFARVDNSGYAGYADAAAEWVGVRPYFLLG